MDKLVSVIVPVYNASLFIDKCITSLLNQTYKNIELILINDGSIDNSLEILKSYEKKYSNIKVFSWENKGASATRNYGLTKVCGEYVIFVDSDDYVDDDYIEVLVNEIGNNDYVVSGYKRYNDNELICCKKPRNTMWSAYKFNSTCGKLYKVEFLRKNNIQFPVQYRIGEDMYFTMLAISSTNKIKFIDYAGYDNYVNLESVTNLANKDKKTRNTKMLNLLQDIEKRVKKSKNIDWNMQMFFYLKTIILHLMTQRYILDKEEYYNECDKYFEWFDKVCLLHLNKRQGFYFQKGEEFKINLICNIFVGLKKIGMERFILRLLQITKVGELK